MSPSPRSQCSTGFPRDKNVLQPIKLNDGPESAFLLKNPISGQLLAQGFTRSKSFPAQSNSYNIRITRSLYFEWFTGRHDRCSRQDRRSGAQRGAPGMTSARGFLGRPLHSTDAPPALPLISSLNFFTPAPGVLVHPFRPAAATARPRPASSAKRQTPRAPCARPR